MKQNNGILVAIIAALALGIGVTGTLLWIEKRAPQPVAAPSAVGAPNQAGVPAPPSTVGMTPAGAAVAMGNYHYDLAQWPQAVAQYRVALAKGLDNPDVHTDLGNALRFENQPQEALKQYQIAQKQDPKHEQSLFNQGGLWAQSLGNSAKGVAAWKTYLKRFPKGQSAAQAKQFIAQFDS